MKGRDLNVPDDYRFGFNGQEKDNEIYGDGNSTTAEYWQYDARLGRRWNMDPVLNVWESPYACFRNNPIISNDVNGDSPSVGPRKNGAGGAASGASARLNKTKGSSEHKNITSGSKALQYASGTAPTGNTVENTGGNLGSTTTPPQTLTTTPTVTENKTITPLKLTPTLLGQGINLVFGIPPGY